MRGLQILFWWPRCSAVVCGSFHVIGGRATKCNKHWSSVTSERAEQSSCCRLQWKMSVNNVGMEREWVEEMTTWWIEEEKTPMELSRSTFCVMSMHSAVTLQHATASLRERWATTPPCSPPSVVAAVQHRSDLYPGCDRTETILLSQNLLPAVSGGSSSL